MPTQAFSSLIKPTGAETLFGFPAFVFGPSELTNTTQPPVFRGRLAIGPTLGEAWSIESLLLSLYLQYVENGFAKLPAAYKELTSQIAELESEITNLEEAKTTAPNAWEKSELTAQQRAIKAEINKLKAEQKQFLVPTAIESLKDSPTAISVTLIRGSDVMAIQFPPKERIGTGVNAIVEEAKTEVSGTFREIIKARLPFDVPIFLGPGQQLELQIEVRGTAALKGNFGPEISPLEGEGRIAIPLAAVYYERIQDAAPPLLRAA